MSLVDIIIPCYNSEKTIMFALKSLENQIENNFNVILINDGSTDNTSETIKTYIGKNKLNIRYIEIDNHGVSTARNIGIRNGNSDYIMFLDSDDIYSVFFVEAVNKYMENNDIDIFMSEYELIQEYSSKALENNKLEDNLNKISKSELFDIYKNHKKNKVQFCNCIYRRDIIEKNNIFFSTDIKYGEDTEFIFKYLYHCENGGVFSRKKLYGYMKNYESATHKVSYDTYQIIEAYKRSMSYWDNEKIITDLEKENIINRAIWTVMQRIAPNKQFFNDIRKKYNVDIAMKDLSSNSHEKMVKYSSMLYNINPLLFRWSISAFKKIKGK